MKPLFFTSFLFLFSISFSQNQNGFTIISLSNSLIEGSNHFNLKEGSTIEKLKERNMFSFSFRDSTFIHSIGSNKNKDEKAKLRSQLYKITNIVAVEGPNNLDLYLITVKSGLSGKLYDYYIDFNGSEINVCQIMSLDGTEASGLTYGGVRFDKLEFCEIQSYD